MAALTGVLHAVDAATNTGRALLNGHGQPLHRDHDVEPHWDLLGTVAYQWRTHPDYRPEFEHAVGDLGGLAAVPHRDLSEHS